MVLTCRKHIESLPTSNVKVPEFVIILQMTCHAPFLFVKKECNVRGAFQHTDSSSEHRRSRSGTCRGSHDRDGRGRNRATRHTYTCLMLCEKFMHNRLVVPITAHPRDCRTAWPHCSRQQVLGQ